METVRLPRSLVNEILEQTQDSPTQEVCGLISSHNSYPARCYRVANYAFQPERRYLMNPAQQIDALRTMRERGEELFAIYHSHPDTPALPSKEDLRQASYPDTLNIIVSLSTSGTLQMNGFRFQTNSAVPVDIIVE